MLIITHRPVKVKGFARSSHFRPKNSANLHVLWEKRPYSHVYPLYHKNFLFSRVYAHFSAIPLHFLFFFRLAEKTLAFGKKVWYTPNMKNFLKFVPSAPSPPRDVRGEAKSARQNGIDRTKASSVCKRREARTDGLRPHCLRDRSARTRPKADPDCPAAGGLAGDGRKRSRSEKEPAL